MVNNLDRGNLPESNSANSNFVGELLSIVLLAAIGAGLKIVTDRLIYKIECSIGDSLSNTIFKQKRYGALDSAPRENSNHYGNSGSVFNSQNSGWSSNPFR